VIDGLLKIHAGLELASTARIEQVDVASQRSAEQGLQFADATVESLQALMLEHVPGTLSEAGAMEALEFVKKNSELLSASFTEAKRPSVGSSGGCNAEPQMLWKSIGRTTASTRCKINELRLRAVLGAPIDVSLDRLLEWLSTQLVHLDPGIKLRVDQYSRLKRGKTTICHRLSVKIGKKEVQKSWVPGGNPFFLHDGDGLQLPYEMDAGAAKDVLNKWKPAVRGALAELMDIFSVESGWGGVDRGGKGPFNGGPARCQVTHFLPAHPPFPQASTPIHSRSIVSLSTVNSTCHFCLPVLTCLRPSVQSPFS
jgi:hypothetical protein